MSAIYLIECDFGKLGKAFVETDTDKSSWRETVRDIASGEVQNVLRVIEVFIDKGRNRDVTADIADDVYAYLDDAGCGCPGYLRDWLDRWCGSGAGAADRLDMAAGLYDHDAARADHLIDLRKHEAA